MIFVARPWNILFPWLKRHTDRMQTGYKLTVAKHIQHLLAHTGHDLHIDHNIRGIGNFNPDFSDIGAQWSHAERDHIHGTPLHAALEQAFQGFLHLFGIDPVIGRTCILFGTGTDKGTVFNAGYIDWV